MNETVIPDWLASFLERLQTDEDLEWEVKAAQGGFPKAAWETVSAFANTYGGWILLGVNQTDVGFDIVGLSNPSRLLDEFWATLRNTSKINYSPCDAEDVTIKELEGKQVLVIRVPEAPRQRRPVYIGNNPYDGTFIRRHSGDYRCTKQEVDRMMREASENAVDSTILTEYSLDDIDRDTLINYRQRYQTLHPADPQNGYDDKAFLSAIGAYSRNRTSNQEGITIAGLLMLGRAQSIREWRVRHLIDYRLIPEDNDTFSHWDDRLTWEGNLLDGFYAIYPRLTNGLSTAFKLQGVTRIDDGPMQAVLREALINLLAHTDYTEREVSLIIRTPSNILFRNPGSSRVPIRELFKGDRSDPRNPNLVRMFRRIGLAEEAGTGIPKIIRAWRELGLQMPGIESETERYEFKLQLRQAHLLPAEDRRWLRSLGNQWTELEQIALVHAKHHDYIDTPTLSKLTGRHRADASRTLVSLRDRQFLEMVASGRSAHYKLGERGLAIRRIGGVLRHDPKQPKSIPNDLWKKLLDMSSHVREQPRIESQTTDEAIVQLCSQTPMSIDNLAVLLGRSRRYLRIKIISRLLMEGRIQFLFPYQPNHPAQRYVAEDLISAQVTSQYSTMNIKPASKEDFEQESMDI